MPSISTILLLAATAFAAFTSASPIASSDSVVSRETSAFVGADVGVNVGVVGVGSPHCPHGCPPIPVILAKVYAKVAVVSENLGTPCPWSPLLFYLAHSCTKDAIIAANAIVDVDAVRPCLNDLKVILADAVVQVRALSGLSVGVVLTLGAKTLSVPEFSHILVSLLSVCLCIPEPIEESNTASAPLCYPFFDLPLCWICACARHLTAYR